MDKHEYGPLQEYGVVWKDGRAEVIKAHQVLLPVSSVFFGESQRDNRITFHGEINGEWRLILDAPYSDVQSVRLLADETADEAGS